MDEPTQPLSPNVLVAIGSTLLFIAYWLIFALTTDDGLLRAGASALYNAAPAIILAIVTHLFLTRFVWTWKRWIKLAIQVPAAILFAFLWYLLILVVRSLRSGWAADGFLVAPFVPVAFAWQMFQGVTFYALAALASLAIVMRDQIADLSKQAAITDCSLTPPTTIMVRTGNETQSVAIDDIVSVSGAGDYAEIVLADRTILSATRLGKFEDVLPDHLFIRAHRSHIVRLTAITRSEPAGNGRTVLHLSNGSSVVTSRSGSRAFREAAI